MTCVEFWCQNTSTSLIFYDAAGVGPGKQVAVGTGQFEDLDCG